MKTSPVRPWTIQTGRWIVLIAIGGQLFGSYASGSEAALSSSLLISQSLVRAQKSAEEIEYQVKAAFIYNFMKFTDWPKEAMDPSSENGTAENTKEQESSRKPPMTIGIVGDNPFGEAFTPLLDKKIKDRSFQVVLIPGMADYLKKNQDRQDRNEHLKRYFEDHGKVLRSAHVLVYCDSEKEYLSEHLNAVQDRPILTIGDVKDFVEHKGIIEFVKEENKIRFEIHQAQAERQHLKISSQLLKLARRVIQEKDSNAGTTD